MECLKISLVDLDPSSSPALTHQFRALFDGSHGSPDIGDSFCVTYSDRLSDRISPPPDVVFLILPEPVGDVNSELIRSYGSGQGCAPMIAVVERADPGELIELFKLGVADFITAPIRAADVLPRIWRLSEYTRKKGSLSELLKKKLGLRQILGTSPVFKAELAKIPFIACCDSSVLISGETGTGKEMFARAIHYLGPRAGKPFTPFNCGAVPVELVENELFGHARGAFTSAMAPADGIIHETDGGTLFLDEIDCLPLVAQVKLLRFLQEKEYRPLGSTKTSKADVRIIAATNIALDCAVDRGTFRRDLYYRLNIIPLVLPALRERPEDIVLLARHFVARQALELNKHIEGLSQEAERELTLYDWPGNVRELQNVIERAAVFSSGRVLEDHDIDLPRMEPSGPPESLRQAKARVIVEFEKKYILRLLTAHRGNITRAAQTAGKNRRALWELIRKYEIDVRQFRFSD